MNFRFLSLFLCSLLAALHGASARASENPHLDEPRVDPGNLRAFIELVRSDIKTQKALIIAQNLQLTDEEAVDFWPLHSEYTLALDKLLDERLRLLRDYLGTGTTMTDSEANRFAGKVFQWERKRTQLKQTWFKKFSKAVPAKKAVRFFQIENQLNAALDLRLAAALPLLE